MEKYNVEQLMSTYGDVLATVYQMLGAEDNGYYIDYQPNLKWRLDKDFCFEVEEDGEYYDMDVFGSSVWVSEYYTAIAHYNNGTIELIVLDNENKTEE